MSFLDGLKEKAGAVAGQLGPVAGKLQGAKDMIGAQTAHLAESGMGQMAKANLAKLSDQASGVTSYISSSIDASGLGKYFPTGGGKHQSPIDIITSEAKFDESLGDGGFTFGYTARDAQSVTNTGNSLVINFAENANSTMTAVHYTGEQQLRQVVLHWGTEPMNGSEHLIGGVGYAGEVQLVHMNTKYTSWDEALKHADGLAIICVFLNEAHDDNPALTLIMQKLASLQHAGDTVPLERGFDARSLLPDKMEYWTYPGSLTSVPHSECAIWSVYRSSIPISSTQLDKLRQLYAVKADEVDANPTRVASTAVRAPQPTNGRAIRASFRSGGVIAQ